MLTSLALILLCGMILGELFKKIGLPSLIGMLITGIVLGPYVLNILDTIILEISPDLREIALIIILTRAGLSLELDDLKKVGRPAVLMSFVPACFEMFGTVLLSTILFGFPLLDAAILAAVVASASPAVIVPRMIRLIEENYGTNKSIPQLILAGDSIDDMFNIVVFTSLLGLTSGESISIVSFVGIPLAILFGILGGALLGCLLTILFKKIHLRDSIKVVVLLGVSFLLVTVEDLLKSIVPFSGLLAIMTIGIIILKLTPKVASRISTKFSKLWVGAEILLFVLVGASVDISYASTAGLKTVLLLIVVLFIRALGILLCLVGTNLNWKERLFCMLTGIPKATVQAAIGGIPLAMGLPNGGIILAVAVFSILFTAPLGAFLIDSSYVNLLETQTYKCE